MLFNINSVVDANKFDKNNRSVIQKSGRLGFTREGASLLGLEKDKRMLVSPLGNGDLAVIIVEATDTRGFKIQKAGDYFYVRMRNYWDSIEIDYVENRVSFSISMTQEEYEKKTVFKFKRIIDKRKDSDKEDIPDNIPDNNDEE